MILIMLLLLRRLWSLGHLIVLLSALMPLLSEPVALGNCKQIHLGGSESFSLEAHPKGGNYDGV